ncbi:polyadenylate-binding protein-interacting protein 1-like, partial [Stegodyphus dumicola]|uniref:polyadenylate-binding protein-interacting protein 1-like n=1 Tax=Stegodyphus dumicola TaxID=202533 RepID=UPI0015AD2542
MEQNEGTPVGYGRGRPTDTGALRRPLAYNTYASQDFVPTEGSNPNGLFAETSWHDPSRDFSYMASPSGDHARPQNHSVTPDSNSSERKPVSFSKLSPYAEVFVPRNFRPEPRVPPAEVPEESLIDSLSDSYPVQELRSFLNEITMCPGKFERRIQPLTETLNSMVDDDDTMRAIVNIILDESVRQPNLRYSGARLCKTLCDDLVVPPDRNNFRNILLLRCNQEFKRRESLAQAEDGGTYFRGFAMFLAELFSQLEVKKQKISVLGDNLPFLIKTVLAYGCPENFKCACQILKLVGAYLEDYERAKIENNGMAPEMDSIMCTLKNLSSNTEYS